MWRNTVDKYRNTVDNYRFCSTEQQLRNTEIQLTKLPKVAQSGQVEHSLILQVSAKDWPEGDLILNTLNVLEAMGQRHCPEAD